MRGYPFAYHKSTHSRLIRTILIPMVAIGAVIVVMIPLLISIALGGDNAAHNRREAASLAGFFGDYRQGLWDLSRDPDILRFLQTGEERHLVYEKLYGFRNSRTVGVGFQAASVDGAHRAEADSTALPRPYQAVDDVLLGWKLRGNEGVVGHTVSPASSWSRDKAPLFALAVNVREEDGTPAGLLAFLFTMENIDQFLVDPNRGTVIVNENNHVVYSGGVNLSYPYKKFSAQKVFGDVYRLDGQLYLLHKTRVGDFDLWACSLSSLGFLPPLLGMEAGVAGVLILLMILVIYRVSYQATKVMMTPFDRIFTALKQYREGDTLSRIPLEGEGDEEMARYLSQFNTILDEIDLLLEKNRELASQSKTAEIKVLQAQFNPHFIFNMLETIKYMVSDDPEGACRTILTLSKLLRYTLAHSQEALIPLEQDIRYIEDYLSLQQLRLGESFSYRVDAPPEALACRVPKLIMLPIVENSIAHGYTGEAPLQLTITAQAGKGALRVTVKDNGRGIPPAGLRALRRRLRTLTEDHNHIGVVNTHKRLRLHYGEEYGVKIESQAGKGTTVHLAIKMGG